MSISISYGQTKQYGENQIQHIIGKDEIMPIFKRSMHNFIDAWNQESKTMSKGSALFFDNENITFTVHLFCHWQLDQVGVYMEYLIKVSNGLDKNFN